MSVYVLIAKSGRQYVPAIGLLPPPHTSFSEKWEGAIPG